MRDGEHRECPIVPNEIIRLRYGEGEDDMLRVAPTHDTIQMFPDPQYNYLRYYDAEQEQMIAVFLAHEILADLVDGGIPLCIRGSITEAEVEIYETHVGKMVASCIEIEEVQEPQLTLTDAEIEYFWKEIE